MTLDTAAVLALGGGFQAYFRQKSDMSIYEWPMDVMAEVAAFCRARQPYCHKAQSVPQAAMLFSGESVYRNGATISRAFGPWGDHGGGLLTPARGCLQAVLDLQYSVDVLLESYLAERVDSYPLVIIPEWNILNEALKMRLLAYVKDGGNLLLIGPDAADLFAAEMDITWVKDKAKESRFLESDGFFANVNTECRMAKLGVNAKSWGMLYGDFDVTEDNIPAASITAYGKGKIAATYFNLGQLYVKSYTFAYRTFLGKLMDHLFPEPKVTVSGSPYVEVAINMLNEKLMVNLINTSGPHADKTVRAFDTITPVGPLEVVIRTGKKPKSVMLQPAGVKLDYTYRNAQVTVNIPKLIIHDVIVLD